MRNDLGEVEEGRVEMKIWKVVGYGEGVKDGRRVVTVELICELDTRWMAVVIAMGECGRWDWVEVARNKEEEEGDIKGKYWWRKDVNGREDGVSMMLLKKVGTEWKTIKEEEVGEW